MTTLGRVVAIDMPGFGHSDQTRPELIAPNRSGQFLARLIDEWDLAAPHVVGPDVGTAAALFLAAKSPEKVTSLTVGGGAVRYPIEAGGGLNVNVILPGLIDTRMPQLHAEWNREDYDSLKTRISAQTPLKRVGSPEDCAAAVSFLCSEDASFITGQILAVSGGL